MQDEVDQQKDVIKLRRRFRGAATFFIVIYLIGLISITVGYFSNENQALTEHVIEYIFTFVGVLIAALAAWHASRLAALSLSLILLISLISLFFTQADQSIILRQSIRLFIYFLLSLYLLRNMWRYYALRRTLDAPIEGWAWLRWLGIGLLLPYFGMLVLGLTVLSFGVSSAVIKGQDIPVEQLDWMVEQNFLHADETPLYFYSEALFAIREGGNLLTDKYAGSWWLDDGELQSVWFRLGEICRVELTQPGDYITDAIYTLYGPGEDNWMQVWLSIEDDQHKRFISRLKTLNQFKLTEAAKTACAENRAIDKAALALENNIQPGFVAGPNMSEAHIKWLKQQNYLLNDEQPVTFYSYGAYHINEGGLLLTNSHIGGWYLHRGKQRGWWQSLGKICRIEPEEATNEMDVLYRFTAPEDDWFVAEFPKDDEQNQAFLDDLQQRIDTAQTAEDLAACQAAPSTL